MDWPEGVEDADDHGWHNTDERGAHDMLHKHKEVRVVVGITCTLSIIGSLLIILSYLCFRDLRSRARLILVHISIMDCGVGLSNLIGAWVYFDRFYTDNTDCPPWKSQGKVLPRFFNGFLIRNATSNDPVVTPDRQVGVFSL